MEGRQPDPNATATGLDPKADPAGDLFIAEGEKVIRRLLSSHHETVSVLISEPRLEAASDLLQQASPETPVFVVLAEHADALTGFPFHRGLLALGRYRSPGSAGEVMRSSAACVVCESLANHDNVGSIFRSLRGLAPEARGFEHPACVLLSPRCCDPLYRKALRVSMGQALHVPFATLEPWPEGLETVAEAGFELIALDPGAESKDLREVRPARTALLVGAEGPGLSDRALEAVNRAGGNRVRIPIEPGTDSLNAGVAASIAMYVLLRGG